MTPPRPSGASGAGRAIPEVTRPTREAPPPGIRTHRTQTLTRRDVRRHRNIRVTSPSRTILDIQNRLTDRQLTRAVNELRLHEHLRATELQRLLDRLGPDRQPHRPDPEPDALGQRRIASSPSAGRTASRSPRTNVMLFGTRSTPLFEAEKVIVEIDSWDTHKDHESFQSDRKRDAVAAEHGYLTVRLTSDLPQTPTRQARPRASVPDPAPTAGRPPVHKDATFIGHHRTGPWSFSCSSP